MWQALRDELLRPNRIELVTVGMETQGAEACRQYIEAAIPDDPEAAHPSLIDEHHSLSSLFGVINIPSSVWIDEGGTIVRPAEPAPAPPAAAKSGRGSHEPRPNAETPRSPIEERFGAMMAEVGKMTRSTEAYHDALRDWAEKGADSRFSLSPAEVIARSQPRDEGVARGHAHFELASRLEQQGQHEAAIRHFREAHRLVPDSWTFRRQAWTLEGGIDGPLARFWQGPSPGAPEEWPYEGDWLSDVRKVGPENYNPDFEP